jgi:hypothetical protein
MLNHRLVWLYQNLALSDVFPMSWSSLEDYTFISKCLLRELIHRCYTFGVKTPTASFDDWKGAERVGIYFDPRCSSCSVNRGGP